MHFKSTRVFLPINNMQSSISIKTTVNHLLFESPPPHPCKFLDLPQTTTATTGGEGRDQCESIYCSVGGAAGVAGIVAGVIVAILLVLVSILFLCYLSRR